MFLMITLLSQPLFHSPDEYLVILNPFATYFTSRRCKNVKNLYVSLINLVVSYDSAGYVSSAWNKSVIGNSLYERDWRARRDRNVDNSRFASYFDFDRVQAAKYRQFALPDTRWSPNSQQSFQRFHLEGIIRRTVRPSHCCIANSRRLNYKWAL